MSAEKQVKVLFIKGRPDAHPIHNIFANSVNSTHIFEDFILRWHDIPTASKLKRYTSWFLSALFMPKQYDVYFTECVRVPLLLMKKMGLMKKHQKIIALMDDESLYFLYAKRYPKITQKLIYAFLKNSDALICVGEFQTWLAKEILKDDCPPIATAHNGIKQSRLDKLKEISFNPDAATIVHIGNFGMNFRIHYKGLDLMVQAFDEVRKVLPNIKFYIIGENDEASVKYLQELVSEETLQHLIFTGKVSNIEDYLSNASLYLHTARGEAFGISIVEAMAAGVPALISDMTGVRSLVREVSPQLVAPLDKEKITQQIIQYFSLSKTEKMMLSQKSRDVASLYSEEYSSKTFVEAFNQVAY